MWAKAAGAAFDASCGRLTISVALQDFFPDGFLDLLDGVFSDEFVGAAIAVQQRIDDSGLRPLVQLLHE